MVTWLPNQDGDITMCKAHDPKTCRYHKDENGNPLKHYATKAEARKAYEASMRKTNRSTGLKKTARKSVADYAKAVEDAEGAAYDSLHLNSLPYDDPEKMKELNAKAADNLKRIDGLDGLDRKTIRRIADIAEGDNAHLIAEALMDGYANGDKKNSSRKASGNRSSKPRKRKKTTRRKTTAPATPRDREVADLKKAMDHMDNPRPVYMSVQEQDGRTTVSYGPQSFDSIVVNDGDDKAEFEINGDDTALVVESVYSDLTMKAGSAMMDYQPSNADDYEGLITSGDYNEVGSLEGVGRFINSMADRKGVTIDLKQGDQTLVHVDNSNDRSGTMRRMAENTDTAPLERIGVESTMQSKAIRS